MDGLQPQRSVCDVDGRIAYDREPANAKWTAGDTHAGFVGMEFLVRIILPSHFSDDEAFQRIEL